MAKVDNTNDKVAKPFVKWAGGKSRVADEIASYFPDKALFGRYYEPFLGSAALYFKVSPQKGRLNDKNKTLINTYLSVKQDPDGLIKELLNLQKQYFSLNTESDKKQMYLEKRDEFNLCKTQTSLKSSALFIFLNKTGFNGMYRENLSGNYNIPFGRHNKPLICDADNIRVVSSHLKDIDLTSGSYEEAVKDAKKGDLVYLDPPYYPLTSQETNFNEYQAGGFGVKDQEELRDVYKDLADRGCYVVMSNSNCDEIKKLYKDFNIQYIKVARAINSNGKKRNKIDEVVITNFTLKDGKPC